MEGLKTFTLDHVLRNTAPKLNNRLFKDRTGEKVGIAGGGTATISKFFGYNHGVPAWWCELDAQPGVFILRNTTSIANNQRYYGLRKPQNEEAKEVNEIALCRELGKISIFGSVPQYSDGKIWIALRCISKIDSRLYARVYSRVKKSPEMLKVMHDRPKPVCSVGREAQEVMHVEVSYLEKQFKKENVDFHNGWIRNRLGAGWDSLLKVRETYLLKKPAVEKPATTTNTPVAAPDFSVEVNRHVDLLPYVRTVVGKMLVEDNGIKDAEMADRLSRKIANTIFMNKEIERQVIFKKEDVDAILSPEFKLNSLLGVLSSK